MAELNNKKSVSKPRTTVAIQPSARYLWLASLGVVVALRRASRTKRVAKKEAH